MYHPLPMQQPTKGNLPARFEDCPVRTDEPAVLTYRSEAFAEDLAATHALPVAGAPSAARGVRSGLLLAVPLGALLAGAIVAFGLS